MFSDNIGNIYLLDFTKYFESQYFFTHYSLKTNYNAHRNMGRQTIDLEKYSKIQTSNIEDLEAELENQESKTTKKYSERPKKENQNSLQYKILNIFSAHSAQLKSFKIEELDQKHIMSFGFDHEFKIHDYKGNLICQLNILHPLPTVWNMPEFKFPLLHDKIIKSLKVVEILNMRYKSTASSAHVNLRKLKKQFLSANKQDTDGGTFLLTQPPGMGNEK